MGFSKAATGKPTALKAMPWLASIIAGGADTGLGVSAISEADWGLNVEMPQPRRYYGENHLHYLTTSTYRRARVFDSERFKRHFVRTLAELRAELGFRIVGYVLMPEHFHLLIWPLAEANPSQILQKLKAGGADIAVSAMCAIHGHGLAGGADIGILMSAISEAERG